MKLIFTLFIALGLLGCAESSFDLAKDSSLPIWFTLEDDVSRGDYRITMDYYVSSSGRTAVLKLKNAWGFTVKKVEANLDGLTPQKMPGVTEQRPTYEVLRAHGKIEVVEHRVLGPFFRVTNNEIVRAHFILKKSLLNDT